MKAKSLNCHVTSVKWLTDSVLSVRFEPSKKFDFEPGQFVSVMVPTGRNFKGVKRCYSLANSPEDAKVNGYELCVKVVPGGTGSEFIASLHVGDHFRIAAPYGDFQYKKSGPGRDVVFIATGTGIAPFKSIVSSRVFKEHFMGRATLLFGARDPGEILFPKEFEKHTVRVQYAISRPPTEYTGFKGRVTDLLKNGMKDCRWHSTDFYICGNGDMAGEVVEILVGLHGVNKASIHRENFSTIQTTKRQITEKVREAEQVELGSLWKKQAA